MMSHLFIALFASPVAVAADVMQEIHEQEWDRASADQFVSLLAGASAAERVAIAVALGRLRSTDALDTLRTLRADRDASVRVAAARSLAWTPGSVSEIRDWLSKEPFPDSFAARERASDGVIVALIESLGFQGEPSDIPRLASLSAQPWPVGGAAARALGRMGVRKVSQISDALPALLARLDATDPRMAADASWALARIGIPEGTELQPKIRERLRTGGYETTRAWLVRAAWQRMSQQTRDELFVDLATGPSRLVKVALFGALTPQDAQPDVLVSWVSDPDPWVRRATIDALGRDGSERAVELLSSIVSKAAPSSPSLYEAAAAIRAGGEIETPLAKDMSPILRAAWLSHQKDPAAWLSAALEGDNALVRSTGAGALVDDTSTSWGLGETLLSAKDPAVREAAIDLIKRAPPEKRASLLLVHLRVETAPDVLGAGLRALSEVVSSVGSAETDALDMVLRRVALAAEPQVRAGANTVLAALSRPLLPARAPSDGTVRELVLPSGDVVKVAAGRPALQTVSRIRAARVETSEGSFLIALDPDTAPLAVWNFAMLAEAGFFDGLLFHRVIPGFVAQTGCPRGDGWGGTGTAIPDEVSALPYGVGAVGMARSDRDTGSSQWFITTAPQPHLVGEYTRFGSVAEGMDVVKQLSEGSTVVHVSIERTRAPESEKASLGDVLGSEGSKEGR